MCKVTASAFEFIKKFPTAESVRLYLEKQRWNNKPICPKCGHMDNQHKQVRDNTAGYYRCHHCRSVYTVRTGTIFERSHVPLDKWLFAIYLVVTNRKGVSSVQLSKEIGVTQKTAWFMLQRIREACNDNDNDNDPSNFLKDIFEADEIYIGGKETNKHEHKKLKAGRGAVVGKVVVLGVRERNGRVRAKVVSNTTQDTIHNFLNTNIHPTAALCTDEHRSYNSVKFNHLVVNIQPSSL